MPLWFASLDICQVVLCRETPGKVNGQPPTDKVDIDHERDSSKISPHQPQDTASRSLRRHHKELWTCISSPNMEKAIPSPPPTKEAIRCAYLVFTNESELPRFEDPSLGATQYNFPLVA